MSINIRVDLMSHGFSLPTYATPGSNGADIYSADDALIGPGERQTIRTGLRFELPQNWELQVRSRSGLAANAGIHVLNSPGTVDSDYRGELLIVLHNTGHSRFMIERGMRIAQIVPALVERANFQLSSELSETARGEGRFGSTGA